jgi:hypothetical protein
MLFRKAGKGTACLSPTSRPGPGGGHHVDLVRVGMSTRTVAHDRGPGDAAHVELA